MNAAMNEAETDMAVFTRPMIYSLIPRVMADIGAVTKDRKNEQQKYAFRGIEDFYQAAHPALIRHGVFCAPEVLDRTEYRFDKVNYEGKTTSWIHVTMKVRHRFFAEDGSFIDVITCGEGLDNSDKASNKAMSGAMKYALIELFCVPTKDVEDSDRDSPETGTRRKSSAVTDKPIELGSPARSGTDGTKGSSVTTASNGGERKHEQAAPAAQPTIFVEELKKEVAEKQAKPKVDLKYVEFEGGLSVKQKQEFAIAFEDACHAKMASAEKKRLRGKWLVEHGFKDDQGQPTSARIWAKDLAAMTREACSWVRPMKPNEHGLVIDDSDVSF